MFVVIIINIFVNVSVFLYTKKTCVSKQMQRLNISKNVLDLFKNPIQKLLAKYKRKEKDPDDEEKVETLGIIVV